MFDCGCQKLVKVPFRRLADECPQRPGAAMAPYAMRNRLSYDPPGGAAM
jgi:hypothetical protein